MFFHFIFLVCNTSIICSLIYNRIINNMTGIEKLLINCFIYLFFSPKNE